MAKRRTSADPSSLPEYIEGMNSLERDTFLAVIQSSVMAMHSQAPINRIKAMDNYFQVVTGDAITLGKMFVEKMREMKTLEIDKDN